jgi:hypothetical protein
MSLCFFQHKNVAEKTFKNFFDSLVAIATLNCITKKYNSSQYSRMDGFRLEKHKNQQRKNSVRGSKRVTKMKNDETEQLQGLLWPDWEKRG